MQTSWLFIVVGETSHSRAISLSNPEGGLLGSASVRLMTAQSGICNDNNNLDTLRGNNLYDYTCVIIWGYYLPKHGQFSQWNIQSSCSSIQLISALLAT